MKFVTAEQRTPEWYAARLGRVTGSRVKDVMAVSKRDGVTPLKAREDYKRELVTERLAGSFGEKEVFVTEAMRWGMQNEAMARTQYQLATGNKVSEEGFCQHDKLMVGVSTDGLVNKEGNLEIKCLAPHNHLYNIVRNGDMPDDYRDQVQAQMWITDRYWCDFVGYDSRMPPGLDLVIARIGRDNEYIMLLEENIKSFLEEVEKEVWYFSKYLPIAKRVCRVCGVYFIDKVNICPECKSNHCVIKEIIQEPEIKLVNATPEAKKVIKKVAVK